MGEDGLEAQNNSSTDYTHLVTVCIACGARLGEYATKRADTCDTRVDRIREIPRCRACLGKKMSSPPAEIPAELVEIVDDDKSVIVTIRQLDEGTRAVATLQRHHKRHGREKVEQGTREGRKGSRPPRSMGRR